LSSHIFGFLFIFAAQSAAADTASLRMQNSQYISSGAAYYRDGAAGDNTSLTLKLQRQKRLRKNVVSELDLKNEFSATENWNYFNLYQAHVKFRGPMNVAMNAGRKIETWSAMEDEWRQGVFQPRYTQNKLRTETAGNVGLFTSSSVRSFVWTAAVMPVFVPDLGAHFWVSDHKFASKNPWFDPPAPTFKFREQIHEIHYSVDKPRVEEVMAHPGAMVKVERSLSAVGSRMAVGYKPVPQLLLGFPSLNKVIIGSNGSHLDVVVTPRVQYHWVASTDVWFKRAGWTLGAGLTHDRPNEDRMPSGWTSQTYSPAWIWSLSASRALEAEGAEAARIKFGVIKIEGGVGRDRGEFATERSLFEGRFQYDEAYMTGVMVPLRRVFKNPLELEARVIYDRVQNGGTVSASAGYSFSRDWRVDADADLLGLAGNNAENENGFFSTYRANDRVGMGMTYVF